MKKRKERVMFKDMGNIWWKDIKSTDIVEDLGTSYIVRTSPGKSNYGFKLVYWSGTDAKEAQRYLKERSEK